jgi:hypothetical protein
MKQIGPHTEQIFWACWMRRAWDCQPEVMPLLDSRPHRRAVARDIEDAAAAHHDIVSGDLAKRARTWLP